MQPAAEAAGGPQQAAVAAAAAEQQRPGLGFMLPPAAVAAAGPAAAAQADAAATGSTPAGAAAEGDAAAGAEAEATPAEDASYPVRPEQVASALTRLLNNIGDEMAARGKQVGGELAAAGRRVGGELAAVGRQVVPPALRSSGSRDVAPPPTRPQPVPQHQRHDPQAAEQALGGGSSQRTLAATHAGSLPSGSGVLPLRPGSLPFPSPFESGIFEPTMLHSATSPFGTQLSLDVPPPPGAAAAAPDALPGGAAASPPVGAFTAAAHAAPGPAHTVGFTAAGRMTKPTASPLGSTSEVWASLRAKALRNQVRSVRGAGGGWVGVGGGGWGGVGGAARAASALARCPLALLRLRLAAHVTLPALAVQPLVEGHSNSATHGPALHGAGRVIVPPLPIVCRAGGGCAFRDHPCGLYDRRHENRWQRVPAGGERCEGPGSPACLRHPEHAAEPARCALLA